MAKQGILIKDSHRGLRYEDGVSKDVLGAGRFVIPRHIDLGFYRRPRVQVVLVDVRERHLTIKGQETLTADKVAIRVSIIVQFRVIDPVAALHQVENYKDRFYSDIQLAARRSLATTTLEQILEKPTRMPLHPPPAAGPKTVQVMKSEEKGSDVNLACYLLVDAFDDDYEAAVVVSNDSDLAEPIRLVRQKFRKKVLVLHPCSPGRPLSVELRRVASKSLIVDTSLLPTSQFPATLTDAHGTIHKPGRW